MRLVVTLAVTGALALAVAATLVDLALGLAVAGVELICGAYVTRYYQARP